MKMAKVMSTYLIKKYLGNRVYTWAQWSLGGKENLAIKVVREMGMSSTNRRGFRRIGGFSNQSGEGNGHEHYR